MNKIKILYVLSYISNNGGVQAVVNNYYNELTKYKNIEIDFLVLLPGDETLENKYIKKGSKIFHINGSKEKNVFLFIKEIKKFFKEHHDYDIIHSQQTNLDFFYLKAAKKYKIPVRIMHSHSTNCSINKIRMLITKKLSSYYSNYHFACSIESGKYYFGKKFLTMKKSYIQSNAIDIKKYKYNEVVRNEIRKELKLDNKFVIGNVARMDENKNHECLLKIFYEIEKINSNSILLLVGDGPLKEKIIEQAKNLNLEDKVIFYGISNKTNNLMQAMDCYVLPSKYEGVPLTVIEATASGLNCFISNSIDSHLINNPYEFKIDLNKKPKELANKIIDNTKNQTRNNSTNIIKSSGFCIEDETLKLYKKYIEICEGIK